MLPIKKVVLYKHGIGYFERQGEVEGDATVDLRFRASEMNDVLKSLTLLDLGGGLISSVNYESTLPLEKKLEEIAVQLPDENTLTGLLSQLKGAPIQVEVGSRKVEGVLTGIETVTRQEGLATVTANRLVVLIEGQSLQSFDLLEVKSVTLLSEGLRKDLSYLLDTLISAKKKDLKRLTILARGRGFRSLFASYTVEAPVWKTSYRLLLSAQQPLLQGWAMVDNTQDEDWSEVCLVLVAGLPISFIHDLYSPRYARRPVVKVSEESAYAPPVLESGAHPCMDMESEAMPLAPMAVSPAPAQKSFFLSKAAPVSCEMFEQSIPVQTRTAEIGDLFQYEIKNPVTVKRGQSALVPIVQQRVDGKRVGIYNPEIREKNPMSAVFLKNSTGMTLEGGPVAVLEESNYVGEAMLATLRTGEERVVPYSVELGVTVVLDHASNLRDIHQTVIVNGVLRFFRYRVETKTYLIDNRTDRTLDLFLEHRFRPGWELFDTCKPAEITDHFYRFRFDVPARKTMKFTVCERGDELQEFGLGSVGVDQIEVWRTGRIIDEKTSKELTALAELNSKIAEIDRRIREIDQEVKDLFQDQERLRQNLQAIGKTQEEQTLRERYVRELADGEDRIKEHRIEIKRSKGQKDQLLVQLRARIGQIHFAWDGRKT